MVDSNTAQDGEAHTDGGTVGGDNPRKVYAIRPASTNMVDIHPGVNYTFGKFALG
jgi:hypothetical protein